jgi:hypothetical protein
MRVRANGLVAALALSLSAAPGRAQPVTRARPPALEPAVPQVEARLSPEPDAPPWVDEGDVPVPAWARSVAPTRSDAALYAAPGALGSRRGSAQLGARLPLSATQRAGGCQGRWLNVGPLAWICSDVADYAAEEPSAPELGSRPWLLPGGAGDVLRPRRPGVGGLPPLEPLAPSDDGLPYRYFFAGAGGAYGFANLGSALDDSPDQELEQGFAVAIVEERTAHGEAWGRTKKGLWVAMRELVPSRPFLFHGELVERGALDVAWVTADKASVFASALADKAVGVRVRFEKVRVREEKGAGTNLMVRVEGAAGEAGGWMRARDLSRALLSAPPTELADRDRERWIDVDLAQQTVTAYEGTTPVFATIASTGKGPPRSEFATHPGVHRVWVKIFTTKMDNLEKEDVEKHYALEDVPWVQFFDKAIALHGAFWHRAFGHIHSHGCVNLAPIDARWLYAFTSPHLPTGWTAVYPTKLERGTIVRVR